VLRLTPTQMQASLKAMLFLDALMRFSAVTLLFAIAVFSLRDARHLIQGRILILVCVTLGSMLMTTAPDILLPPKPIYFALRTIDLVNIVFIWWFALSLFEDDFRLNRLHWAGLGIYLIVGLPMRLMYLSGETNTPLIFDVIIRAVSFAMIAHLLWTALAGRSDDLIETRRRTRLWFTIGTAIASLLIVGGEATYTALTGDNSDPDWLSTSRVALALPVIAYGTYWFMNFRAEFLLFEPATKTAKAPAKIAPKDHALHQRLISAMDTEKLYREHGLSIGGLASKLQIPEHQLRALINKGLGHRNFATFLNQYRLAEAKTALADPVQARTSILTIALDAGYASLATFNRAFKADTGQTPSAYRAAALERAVQN